MYAIATRPVAGSIPIAGRTASRPRVTAIGALHCAPSAEVATNTALLDAPGEAQSCHAAQKRPVGSTSADGSGNARKSRIAQPPSIGAMRTGAPQVAPPSVERDAAIANCPACKRYTTTRSPFDRIAGKTPTPAAYAEVDRESTT